MGNHWLLTVEAKVESQGSPCGVCVGQSGSGAESSPVWVVFASYSFIIRDWYSRVIPFCNTQAMPENRRRPVFSYIYCNSLV
jgi:hypothetical protein